jgi:hypothetical protein
MPLKDYGSVRGKNDLVFTDINRARLLAGQAAGRSRQAILREAAPQQHQEREQ